MATRRGFIKIIGASIGSLGSLAVPAWLTYDKTRAREAGTSRPPLVDRIPNQDAPRPEPLGPQTDGSGRPITHDLDIGRLTNVRDGSAVLRSGIGDRLLHLDASTVVWSEGSEGPYAAAAVQDNDWAEAAGTTLEDYSMVVKRLTLNSIGNMVGVYAGRSMDTISVYVRTGKEPGTYSDQTSTLSFDGRTQFYGGRGNFAEPNRRVDEIAAGSWTMCNGYRSRDGKQHVLQCYLGNELPPADLPEWLSAKLARPGGNP